METNWVGLDIYQPKKVEKYLKLYPCTPLLRGKLSFTLLACNRCLTIGGEHTSIDLTCCETLVHVTVMQYTSHP